VGSGKTPPLRPLVAKPEPPPPPERSLFDRLAESIDADIDAEIREVARAVGALRPRAAPAAPPPPPRSGVGRRVEPDGGDDVIAELQRVGSVKTREIPDSVRAALEADDEPAPSPRAEAAGAEIDDAPALTPSRAVVKAAEDRARIDALHALVVEGDYFQILGVPRDARAHDIRSAYELLAAALAPDALDPSVAAERRAQLVVIREVLDEAARLLADDSLRARYRQHLPLPSDAPPA
jgi:hypothetical protein